eukprot:m.104344 g.104344  ORF g.104344 m.104344 type:complete len:796 (-) comp15075_c1_seq1:852-3239(-)
MSRSLSALPPLQVALTLRPRRPEWSASTQAFTHDKADTLCNCRACKSISKQSRRLEKQQQRMEQLPELPFRVGDRVVLTHDRTGVIRWIGRFDSSFVTSHIHIGVQLDDPIGEHDGILNGKRYFTCPELHGVFVTKYEILFAKGRHDLRYRMITSAEQAQKHEHLRLPPLHGDSSANKSMRPASLHTRRRLNATQRQLQAHKSGQAVDPAAANRTTRRTTSRPAKPLLQHLRQLQQRRKDPNATLQQTRFLKNSQLSSYKDSDSDLDSDEQEEDTEEEEEEDDDSDGDLGDYDNHDLTADDKVTQGLIDAIDEDKLLRIQESVLRQAEAAEELLANLQHRRNSTSSVGSSDPSKLAFSSPPTLSSAPSPSVVRRGEQTSEVHNALSPPTSQKQASTATSKVDTPTATPSTKLYTELPSGPSKTAFAPDRQQQVPKQQQQEEQLQQEQQVPLPEAQRENQASTVKPEAAVTHDSATLSSPSSANMLKGDGENRSPSEPLGEVDSSPQAENSTASPNDISAKEAALQDHPAAIDVQQVAEQLFTLSDVHHVGYLNALEFAHALYSETLGLMLQPGQDAQFMEVTDSDGNGRIDWPEFEAVFVKLLAAIYNDAPGNGETAEGWLEIFSRSPMHAIFFHKETHTLALQLPDDIEAYHREIYIPPQSEFDLTAMYAFHAADQGGRCALSPDEFLAILASPDLGFSLTDEDISVTCSNWRDSKVDVVSLCFAVICERACLGPCKERISPFRQQEQIQQTNKQKQKTNKYYNKQTKQTKQTTKQIKQTNQIKPNKNLFVAWI